MFESQLLESMHKDFTKLKILYSISYDKQYRMTNSSRYITNLMSCHNFPLLREKSEAI